MSSDTREIAPGATIGIFGGGQLGRMTAMAARSLGYHIVSLDPDPSCAARFVVDRVMTASFDDVGAAEALAKHCQVATIEIEKVATAALDAAARHVPVRPGSAVLHIIQNRVRQKQWLQKNGFPIAPFAEVTSAASATGASAVLQEKRGFLKVSNGGYDGRGQERVSGATDVARGFAALGGHACVLEQAIDLESELSVLVARRPSGECAVYPPALNHHVDGILHWSVMPGPLPEKAKKQAHDIALGIAQKLEVEGLLVVEFFWTTDHTLLVNELAPRPHNSFHTTEVACLTSQFEQNVRAVCNLPLGATDVTRPAAIVNLLGDAWTDGEPPFAHALALPGVRLHLYGKRQARPGRKMGHLSASGMTAEQAVERVLRAERLLNSDRSVGPR